MLKENLIQLNNSTFYNLFKCMTFFSQCTTRMRIGLSFDKLVDVAVGNIKATEVKFTPSQFPDIDLTANARVAAKTKLCVFIANPLLRYKEFTSHQILDFELI